MIRIAVTGPECAGKTSLTRWLAEKIFDVRTQSEYAREYFELKKKDHAYNSKDIENIARELAVKLTKAFRASNDALLCDTEFYVLDIWWREKVGGINQELEEFKQTFDFDLFLLCKPDMPWEADPLRENPEDRNRLFDQYQKALEEDGRSYFIVEGLGETRMVNTLNKILRRFPNLMLKEES